MISILSVVIRNNRSASSSSEFMVNDQTIGKDKRQDKGHVCLFGVCLNVCVYIETRVGNKEKSVAKTATCEYEIGTNRVEKSICDWLAGETEYHWQGKQIRRKINHCIVKTSTSRGELHESACLHLYALSCMRR